MVTAKSVGYLGNSVDKPEESTAVVDLVEEVLLKRYSSLNSSCRGIEVAVVAILRQPHEERTGLAGQPSSQDTEDSAPYVRIRAVVEI